MKIFWICCFALFSLGCAHQQRQPSSVPATPHAMSSDEQKIYYQLLTDSLKFYNNHLRDEHSGQYYDSLPLDSALTRQPNSSVASTGMGLIALALADLLEIEKNAPQKVLQTLVFIAGRGHIQDQPYLSKRSKKGWFRHWFDVRNGNDNRFSVADGYSTIDTAILVAGAQLAANYFAAANKDPQGQLRRWADYLLLSVDWSSAIADSRRGSLYLHYDLQTQEAKGATDVFNEYLVLACMGKFAEKKRQQQGPMTAFWKAHYSDPDRLPKKDYAGIPQLTDHPGHYVSHFIIQFATYLCSDVSTNSRYAHYMANAQKADKKWFSQLNNSKSYLWGLGAGEVRFLDKEGYIQSYYHANALEDNQFLMVSPHVVAGFSPVNFESIQDLVSMYQQKECLYSYKDLKILWRCSLMNLSLPITYLQSIDYSSMFLGLSAAHPKIGMKFFRSYSAGEGKK